MKIFSDFMLAGGYIPLLIIGCWIGWASGTRQISLLWFLGYLVIAFIIGFIVHRGQYS